MRLGYWLWLIGVAMAVIIGLSVFGIYNVPVAADYLAGSNSTRLLFVAFGLVALSKLV